MPLHLAEGGSAQLSEAKTRTRRVVALLAIALAIGGACLLSSRLLLMPVTRY